MLEIELNSNSGRAATPHKWTHSAVTLSRCRYSIYLPRRDGRLSSPRWPVA